MLQVTESSQDRGEALHWIGVATQVWFGLWVLVDQVLLLGAQAARQLWLVCQLHPFLQQTGLSANIYALVTYRLDYCNSLYVGLPLKSAHKFQLIQKMQIPQY